MDDIVTVAAGDEADDLLALDGQLVEDDAAEQCAEHAAGESHQTAQTQQVAQQGRCV